MRYRERLGDLGRRHPEPPQCRDHSDAVGGRAIGNPTRRRGTIRQALLTPKPVVADLRASRRACGECREHQACDSDDDEEEFAHSCYH